MMELLLDFFFFLEIQAALCNPHAHDHYKRTRWGKVKVFLPEIFDLRAYLRKMKDS